MLLLLRTDEGLNYSFVDDKAILQLRGVVLLDVIGDSLVPA